MLLMWFFLRLHGMPLGLDFPEALPSNAPDAQVTERTLMRYWSGFV